MPMPESATLAGSTVTVSFSGIEGALQVQGGPTALGVELCEAGPGTCRFALAKAQGDRLLIAVPDGMTPTRVRYAWADAPIVNVVDSGGMPLPGFGLDITP
jgi:sialate O-acetylesterase